ncbi:MAG: AmpG family muropeptide MFS transporter [Alphaproteobacteria bacterium]|nr:AmpG family muropeptide MFS transporter [Alphaproteobacteria bacterium]
MTDRPVPLWRLILSRHMLMCVLTGFSSGLPLYVLITLVPAWLRVQGVDLATIGLTALTGLPYTWKFAWAPLLDRYVPPLLGRRRGWALITQLALVAAIAAFGFVDPTHQTQAVFAVATLVAVASATQDVALDAWRRELLTDAELGLGNAVFVNAYRLAGLIPGGLSLLMADHLPWHVVFPTTAAFVAVGTLAVVLAPEGAENVVPPRTLTEAVVAPFREFFSRPDGRAFALLAFIVLYKLGDSLATSLISVFYLDIGFSLTQVGTIAKVVGLWSSIVGAMIGGLVLARIGIARSLWVFGVVQLVSILGLAGLSAAGPDPWFLAAAVGFEYLGIGLGTAAFVAFLQASVDKRFTATQYALLSSLAAVSRTFGNATTGWLVEQLGWTSFFLLCTVLAVPGMLLLLVVAPWTPRTSDATGQTSIL